MVEFEADDAPAAAGVRYKKQKYSGTDRHLLSR